jgi:hypothetical protein
VSLFSVFDCVNYLRYGSWYLENIKKLEVENPLLHRKFSDGHFVVREKQGTFNSVAPDMRLEQTIQRAQKSSSGIIGQTRRSDYVAKWQLIYHEVLQISNTFRELTSLNVNNHMETCHHQLTGKKSELFDRHVLQLFDFVSDKGNPFLIADSIQLPVSLHNFVTKQMVADEIKHRLLNIFDDGAQNYKQF